MMKKILMILLSVTCLMMVGCGKKDNNLDSSTENTVNETESSIVAEKETEQPTEEAKVTEEPVKEEPSSESDAGETAPKADVEGQEEISKPQKEESKQDNHASVDSVTLVQETPKQEEQTTVLPEPVQPELQVIFYSPQNVVSLATAKTKAAGKVLLTENLDALLANGQISQEEYNEYYPLVSIILLSSYVIKSYHPHKWGVDTTFSFYLKSSKFIK